MNSKEENGVTVVVPAHEDFSETANKTRRILTWSLVIALLILAAGWLLSRPSYDSGSAPNHLVGEWVSTTPEYSDRYITVTEDKITFGTGGTSSVTYSILGVRWKQISGVDALVVDFRDVTGVKFKKTVILDPSGQTMYFVSQPSVIWKRYRP